MKIEKLKTVLLILLFVFLISLLIFESSEIGILQKEIKELKGEIEKCQKEVWNLRDAELFLKVIKNPFYSQTHIQFSGTVKEVSKEKIVLESGGKEIEISLSQNPVVYDTKENKEIGLSELKVGDRIVAVAVLEKEIPKEIEQLKFSHVYR